MAKIAQQKKQMEEFDKKLSSAALESKRTETYDDVKRIFPKATKDSTSGKMVPNHGHLSINRGMKPCFRPNGQLLTFHTKVQNVGPEQPP
jgi:hypothetical protein